MGKVRCLLAAVLCAVLIPAWAHAQQTIHWEASIDSAKRVAGQSNRLVMAIFDAPWCSACRGLEADLTSQPVWISALEANYVPVKLNVDYFQATARQYGITALPTTLILAPTPQGEVLDTIRGRIPADQYVGRLSQVAADVKRRNTAVYAQIPAGPAGQMPGAPAGQPPAATALPPGAAPQQAAGPASGSPPQTAGATAQATPTMGTTSIAPPANPSAAVTGSPAAAAGPAASTAVSAPAVPAPPPIALDGFCPVQLAEKNVWSPGDRRWGAIHRGRTYLFAGADEQRRFLADPDRYAPVNSGDDVVLALEQNRSVPGTRGYGVSFAGRVYLFADQVSLDKFSKNPKYYAERIAQPAGSAMSGGPQVR